jgi:hypothetical protein
MILNSVGQVSNSFLPIASEALRELDNRLPSLARKIRETVVETADMILFPGFLVFLCVTQDKLTLQRAIQSRLG